MYYAWQWKPWAPAVIATVLFLTYDSIFKVLLEKCFGPLYIALIEWTVKLATGVSLLDTDPNAPSKEDALFVNCTKWAQYLLSGLKFGVNMFCLPLQWISDFSDCLSHWWAGTTKDATPDRLYCRDIFSYFFNGLANLYTTWIDFNKQVLVNDKLTWQKFLHSGYGSPTSNQVAGNLRPEGVVRWSEFTANTMRTDGVVCQVALGMYDKDSPIAAQDRAVMIRYPNVHSHVDYVGDALGIHHEGISRAHEYIESAADLKAGKIHLPEYGRVDPHARSSKTAKFEIFNVRDLPPMLWDLPFFAAKTTDTEVITWSKRVNSCTTNGCDLGEFPLAQDLMTVLAKSTDDGTKAQQLVRRTRKLFLRFAKRFTPQRCQEIGKLAQQQQIHAPISDVDQFQKYTSILGGSAHVLGSITVSQKVFQKKYDDTGKVVSNVLGMENHFFAWGGNGPGGVTRCLDYKHTPKFETDEDFYKNQKENMKALRTSGFAWINWMFAKVPFIPPLTEDTFWEPTLESYDPTAPFDELDMAHDYDLHTN